MRLFFLTCIMLLHGCSQNKSTLCDRLQENSLWTIYQHGRTKLPLSILLAIIEAESGFNAYARPVKHWLVPNIIAASYKSSAYGYSQALDKSWVEFEQHSKKKYYRDNYYHSIAFVEWYLLRYRKVLPLSKQNDPYYLYLLYHEGPSKIKQTNTISIETKKYAEKVVQISRRIDKELRQCQLGWQRQWRHF